MASTLQRVRAMRIRVLWFTAVMAASVPAFADDVASETRENAMVEFTPLRRSDVGFRWRADVLAAALATGERADGMTNGTLGSAGSVSGEVGITVSPDCDVVNAGGHIAARTDQPTLAAQQWASLCLLGGNGKLRTDGHLRLDHRLEWDVVPRLLAAPRLRPGLQRRETVALDFHGSTIPLDDMGPLSLVKPREFLQAGDVRLETEVGWSDRHDGDDVRVLFDIVLRTYRREYDAGPPLTIAIFAPRMEVVTGVGPGAPSAAGLAADAARVDGFRLGGLRWGARLGGRVGGIAVGEKMDARSRFVTIGEGALSVETDVTDGLVMRLGGERRSWEAYNASVVVDDRATWSLIGSDGRWRARLDVAAAIAHVLTIGAHRDLGVGGATLAAGVDLGHDLAVELHSEAGRSIYARDATLDAPRWASETLLMLAGHLAGT